MGDKMNFDEKMYEMEKTLKESLKNEEILARNFGFGVGFRLHKRKT